MEADTQYLQIENVILRYENPQVGRECWEYCRNQGVTCELVSSPEVAEFYAKHAQPVKITAGLFAAIINKSNGMHTVQAN